MTEDEGEGEIAQLCLTLCDPVDCSLPGFSVHGILQARILEWVPFPSPGDLPDPGTEPRSPALKADTLTSESGKIVCMWLVGFPGGSVVKNPQANAGNVDLIPGSGRSPGEGNGSILQRSCLGNPMDRGAWRAIVHGVAKESNTI